MAVLARSELEASPLADLHAIANEVGLEGFRRLRKADLIDAILGEASPAADAEDTDESRERPPAGQRARRRRPVRSRRTRDDDEGPGDAETEAAAPGDAGEDGGDAEADAAASPRRSRRRGSRGGSAAADAPARGDRDRDRDRDGDGDGGQDAGRIAAGVVEVLGNGSAFLRVDPPEPSDEDVYISAAQVRRCELVSGDRVTGPVRTPRRSERYPSLVRIDTINGASADAVSDGVRYDELPVDWPRERLALGSQDPTLEAIEWMTPLGMGSRVVIVGARHAGKTETLRRMLETLAGTRRARRERRARGRAPGGDRAVARGPVGARRGAHVRRIGRLSGSGCRARTRRGQACRGPRRQRARGDRQPRRAAPACGAQGARGRAQPARQRLRDRDRDGRASARRRDDRDRARRDAHHRPASSRSSTSPTAAR